MKSKLANLTSTLSGPAMVAAFTMGVAMTTLAADSNLAAAGPPALPGEPVTMIDPATGGPVVPMVAPRRQPDWKDPDKVLSEVTYDNLPLGEVARTLRAEFNDAFDVLIPNGWQDPSRPESAIEPNGAPIKLQLKNVTASEVFNAMNMMFESENDPFRWELRMNGSRPTAVLHVLPQLLPPPVSLPARTPKPPVERKVIFVGEMLGDAPGKMSMEQLVRTLSEVFEMSYGHAQNVIQFHKGAQLLIITGTEDQIGFISQTLSALMHKVQLDQRSQRNASADKKTDLF